MSNKVSKPTWKHSGARGRAPCLTRVRLSLDKICVLSSRAVGVEASEFSLPSLALDPPAPILGKWTRHWKPSTLRTRPRGMFLVESSTKITSLRFHSSSSTFSTEARSSLGSRARLRALPGALPVPPPPPPPPPALLLLWPLPPVPPTEPVSPPPPPRPASDPSEQVEEAGEGQVWSLTQFYSVDFSQ